MRTRAETSETLLEILEGYLKHEGLYNIIPEHRRPRQFRLLVLLLWLASLWIPAAYILFSCQGPRGLVIAVVGPLLLFVASFFGLVVLFLIRQLRSGKGLTDADAGTIGGFFLVGFPVLMAVALGIYLLTWQFALAYIGAYLVMMVVALLLQASAYRVYLLVDLIRSVFRALWRSMYLLLVLMPLLLIVIVLSVFSQELWQVLATLSSSRLVGSVLCLTLPVVVLVLTSLDREAGAIVGQFPHRNEIAQAAKSVPYIESKLSRGLVSEEEWNDLTSELEWRSMTRLAERLLPVLRNKVKRWLALLLMLTSLALVVSFLVYFFVFFSVMLDPQLIEMWTGIQPRMLLIPIALLQYQTELELPSIAIAIAKVSSVLAVLAAVMSSVYAMTDETVKRVFTQWLRHRYSSWLAVSSLYLCAASPNYQVWEYLVRDKKREIANVSIVVPRGLSEKLIEGACEHMESCLKAYKTLVIVTAFEENPERPIYKLGMPGNRWRLLHNKVKGLRVFEPIPLVLDDLRYQHFVGRDSLEKGADIAEEWFGNTPQGAVLGESIWEADADHEWVLHPYVFQSDVVLSVEISLAKRKAESDQYRQCVREFLALARDGFPDARNIWIELTFRDTADTLARLNWSKELPYIEYTDEILGKNRIEKPSAWD